MGFGGERVQGWALKGWGNSKEVSWLAMGISASCSRQRVFWSRSRAAGEQTVCRIGKLVRGERQPNWWMEAG